MLAADLREDHWPVTREAAADMARLPNQTVALHWWHEVMELIAVCGQLGPDRPVPYHHLAGGVRGLLVRAPSSSGPMVTTSAKPSAGRSIFWTKIGSRSW